MEMNMPKMNQRRVATIKYFGELYNYRLIESADVFKVNYELYLNDAGNELINNFYMIINFQVLYSLIMFGVSLNHSVPSPLDPPENLIRIRLTCTLLDTCGKFFTHSDIKTKLPYFFVYFQVGIQTRSCSAFQLFQVLLKSCFLSVLFLVEKNCSCME